MKPIDGTELKKHIESTICYGCEIGHVVTPCGRCHVSNLLRCIDEMPEVEAQPVKHGKWERMDMFVKCSECGVELLDDAFFGIHVFDYGYMPFCPNCGYPMEVEENEQAQ